jgi:NTE family protein
VSDPEKTDVALVLAGGVAKGAFEAGALDVISRARVNVRRIVAASSGGLNAAVYGAALRNGDPRGGADRLCSLWREHATWSRVFDFSLPDTLGLRGLSTQNRVLELLREEVPRQLGAGRNPVSLRLMIAVLEGVLGNIGEQSATTYESVLPFEGADYEDPVRLEAMYEAALVSSAFPVLFPPRELSLTVGGQLKKLHGLDGGVVNNTPVKLALRDEDGTDSGLSTVIVVTPYPRVLATPPELHGVGLVSQMVEILLQERLFRDLHEAEDVNDELRAVDALASEGYTAAQIERIKQAAFDGNRKRICRLIAVRPDDALPGNVFAALFDAQLRRDYIDAGQAAAEKALAASDLV